MERRSTNDIGYVHYQGDIVSNVGSSHGVALRGGSSGGLVDAVGDDTNVSLSLRAQGTAGIAYGRNSTTFTERIQRYFVQFTVPALAANGAAVSTVTVTGLTTNSVLVLHPRVELNSTITGVDITPRCSTAGSLAITFMNNSGTTLSGSTQSAYLLQFRF